MLTTCPACGARASLDVLIADEAARNALAAALIGQGELGVLLVRYLALFRPARRALTWDRVRGLLEEILPAIVAGKIERRGRTWPAPREAWINALGTMLANPERLSLPLKSHGYLYEILCGAADQVERRVEAQREGDRQQAAWARGAQSEPRRAAKAIPEAIRKDLGRYTRKGDSDAID